MKIIIVTGSMKRGGAERVISIVGNYYASLGWDVCLVRCLYPEIEYELDEAIRVVDISRPGSNQMLDTPRLIHRLRSLIKKERPDAVLSFMMTINFITAIACKGLNVRFFPSERNDPAAGRTRFWERAGEWAYAQSTATIMQTSRAKSFFNEKVQRKSVIIPNPVTVKEFASPDKEKVIVTVGRLEPQKNQKMLLDAFSQFLQQHQDYKLRLFGRGSLEEELKSQARNLGIADAVEFMGNVDDVHHRIRHAALFVLCSDYEGLSNALIEAMMMGLPCISTDCAGSDEIIDNGENGIIVKRGDAAALAQAMSKLVDDRELASLFSKPAMQKTRERFSSEIVLEKWKMIIERGIKRGFEQQYS